MIEGDAVGGQAVLTAILAAIGHRQAQVAHAAQLAVDQGAGLGGTNHKWTRRPRGHRIRCGGVATLSLGGPRRFLMRPKGGGPSRSFRLGWGDLMVMGGAAQRTWEHCVPKPRGPANPRISVMFRNFVDDPE